MTLNTGDGYQGSDSKQGVNDNGWFIIRTLIPHNYVKQKLFISHGLKIYPIKPYTLFLFAHVMPHQASAAPNRAASPKTQAPHLISPNPHPALVAPLSTVSLAFPSVCAKTLSLKY
jgi:hypothetical protein